MIEFTINMQTDPIDCLKWLLLHFVTQIPVFIYAFIYYNYTTDLPLIHIISLFSGTFYLSEIQHDLMSKIYKPILGLDFIPVSDKREMTLFGRYIEIPDNNNDILLIDTSRNVSPWIKKNILIRIWNTDKLYIWLRY